jgi:hypothetical protein
MKEKYLLKIDLLGEFNDEEIISEKYEEFKKDHFRCASLVQSYNILNNP